MKSNFRSISGAALMLVIIPIFAGLLACMPEYVPLGNPERARIDEAMSGMWYSDGESELFGHVVFLQPWDKRTWLVTNVMIGEADGAELGEYATEFDASTYEGFIDYFGHPNLDEDDLVFGALQYKGWLAEGGIRNALIVSGPVVGRQPGSVHNPVMHIADIMPTLLEAAETSYPKSHHGQTMPPLDGKSWVPMLSGETESVRSRKDYLAWELFGNRALRQDRWKIRWQWKPFGTGDWELYDLISDPGERSNLSDRHPDKVVAMLELWDGYVEQNNVILPSRSVFETLEDQLPKRVPDDPGYPPLINKRQFVPPAEMIKESGR